MKRIAYLDVAKGFTILTVILGHTLPAGTLKTLLYSFHMPLFFFLSGCTVGDYVRPLLPGNVYLQGGRICSKPDDGNIISNYILYEGKYSNAIKLKRVKGQFDPVCIDINELSPDVIYIGQYMLSSGSKKEYYGFSIIRSGVRILRLDDNHIK